MYALKVLPKITAYVLRFFTSYFGSAPGKESFFESVYRYHYAVTRSSFKIPIKTLIDISGSLAPIAPIEERWESGNMAAFELSVICALVSKNKPTNTFEFGTFNGRTTLNIARNIPLASKIFTLDISANNEKPALACDPQDYSFINRAHKTLYFHNTPYAEKITTIKGDSATFDLSPLFNTMDVVLIDGSHSPQYVKNDTEAALKLIGNNKGIIIWHDYNGIYWKGVTSVLNDYYNNDARFASVFSIENTSLAVLEVNRGI